MRSKGDRPWVGNARPSLTVAPCFCFGYVGFMFCLGRCPFPLPRSCQKGHRPWSGNDIVFVCGISVLRFVWESVPFSVPLWRSKRAPTLYRQRETYFDGSFMFLFWVCHFYVFVWVGVLFCSLAAVKKDTVLGARTIEFLSVVLQSCAAFALPLGCQVSPGY